MRFRFLIERNPASAALPYALTTVDAEGNALGGIADSDTVADAKLTGEEYAQSELGIELRWKEPPKTWQPDAIYVSQSIDDGIEERRDT